MKKVRRAIIETGFIIFLFYANLLMGEFERSRIGQSNGLVWAIRNIFTSANFMIALIAALIGYVLVESLRKKLWLLLFYSLDARRVETIRLRSSLRRGMTPDRYART